MNINTRAVEKSDEVPFWFNPYSELYELLFEKKDNKEAEETDILKVILIGAFTKAESREDIQFEMDELKELVGVLGHQTKRIFIQRISKKSRTQYIGHGKMMEIRDYIESENISYVVCNNELSTLQYKTLSDLLKVPVIDRTMIVLEIFSRNEHTKESKLQVQVALMRYLSSRINMVNASEKSVSDRSNGAFYNRGKGESIYELNQRKIKNKILHIEKEIDRIERSKSIQQKRRKNTIKLILVGYTNAGKTSVMNSLSGVHLNAGNQIFLTTESIYRKIGEHAGKDVLICDTVGFLSNLPTTWIEGFRTTIQEIGEADYILHIVDVSDEHYDRKMRVTEDLLEKIHVDKSSVILVYNKIDQIAEYSLKDDGGEAVCISTFDKNTIKKLRSYIFERIEEDDKLRRISR